MSESPRISERWLDIPSQRFYYLAFGALCQSTKVLDLFRYYTVNPEQAFCRKWLLIDTFYCLTLSFLRIPRLRYSKAVVLLQILSLAILNSILFGGIQINLFGASGFPTSPGAFSFFDVISPLTFGLLASSEFSATDPHLSGQHTVLLSPISTAQLNPNALTFCLAPPDNVVLIPVLLNNTNPSALRYSITPLGQDVGQDHGEYIDLSGKEIKAIEKARLDALQIARPSSTPSQDDYDEYDDDEDTSSLNTPLTHSHLQKTQSLVHIKVSRPGKIRLERVLDSSNTEARVRYSPDVIVAPCPSVSFVPESHNKDNVRCAGQDSEVQLMIDISGVPPLSLRWYKSINGRRESYLVEGIEGDYDPTQVSRKGVPQKFRVPLSVSLESTGSHIYALEEVMDLVGNMVRINSQNTTSGNSESMRTFQILRRPTVSFKHCGPGNPTSILIGSEAPLTIVAHDADDFDAPWEVTVKYQVPNTSEGDDKSLKRLKPWKKTLSAQGNRRDLTLHASAPGEYTIASVKGKWCSGDVLAPETCKVQERPRPSAEIEWKKIHECSGDTGVSASLVFHGTPPFHVYYRIQRDNESPREHSKTFASSRGELTLQPERSGHYKFAFTRVSDAYYGVDLDGPSIDQVIHPLAAAEFVGTNTPGKNKKMISSCDGNNVSVDVDLRGTGPWNLDVRVVGPKSSESILIPGIENSRTTLQIPVPKKVDEEGGSFEIDLVSVEDRYKCKRSLTVPGVSVNVRRVKPTVKFYGEKEKRYVSVLEHEEVNLPLRLTGDAPWRVKYRRMEAESVILSATLTHPNDHLRVLDKGLYELVEVLDSQCPGSVISEASTYTVDWISRPSAKLSEQTQAVYEVLNGSYILPPICENVDDHVDLDLDGRPPFQIMYNIAQDNENGGTRLLDQPTFNSIQRRTRFQLQTSHPGRVYYEVKQVGDAAYPLAKHKNTIIPRAERLLFEQHVSMLPSARFQTRSRLSYCLHDAFVPFDPISADGVVVFEGTPPFRLQMSIKNIISSQADPITIETKEYVWKINLPSYKFTSVGPHHIKIESVSDASNCPHAALDPLATSIWADVAETAAIIPFDRRDHFCVGDVAQFQLEGIPPWTIGYRVNGKTYSHEAKISPFSFQQQHPGEFAITSISHQNKQCKAAITDLQFAVHALPSAQVGHGRRIIQDIHEGDQAEIVFTLIGEPPFTFTYQRSEPSPKKGGKPGKVLETHTVSRIFSREYSIYSALEGTWTVTSISDKYCRYPPAPDSSAEKQKH